MGGETDVCTRPADARALAGPALAAARREASRQIMGVLGSPELKEELIRLNNGLREIENAGGTRESARKQLQLYANPMRALEKELSGKKLDQVPDWESLWSYLRDGTDTFPDKRDFRYLVFGRLVYEYVTGGVSAAERMQEVNESLYELDPFGEVVENVRSGILITSPALAGLARA